MNSPRRATILTVGMLICATFLPAATITVTSAGDQFPLTAPDGVVTLREALTSINGGADVNADVVAVGAYGDNDTVLFNIVGTPPIVISPLTELPAMNVPVIIDGFSQPGASANTQAIGNDAVVPIALIGPSGPLGYGLKLANGTYSLIRGLTIGGFFYGIDIATSHATVEGCFIGTDPAGSATLANENGVKIEAAAIGANAIGGALPSQRNVISGNHHYGIAMASGSGFRNPIQGNYIGVTPDGTAALPNGDYGIAIFSLQGAAVDGPDIGGPTASPGKGPGNVISGNGGGGILINASGVSSTITSGQISGNLIGPNAAGTVALGSGGHGIDIDDVSMQGGGPFGIGQVAIGGNGAGNVISGHDRGIRVAAATALIRGNLIGTDVTGTLAVPNVVGVEIDGVGAFGAGATVGASGVGEGNVIAGNSSTGIRARLGNANVKGNRIGVGLAGGALGNGGHGVEIDSASATIGGASEDDGNVIAHNGDTGVEVVIGSPGLHNASYARIQRNAIYDNGLAQVDAERMAINLDVGDQQTPNDPGDPDAGPNDLQNYPLISSATIVDGVLTVSGELDSPAAGDYRVEIFASPTCNPNGSGDGKTFLGFVALGDGGGGGSASPQGTSTIFSNLSFPVPDGQPFITATATDNAVGATSELSPCIEATFGGSSPVPLGGEAVINSNAAGAQERPAIASSAQGTVVVAWQSEAADGSGRGIAARRFSAGGQALGAELLVNQTVAGDQTNPALAADDAGRFVVAWQGENGVGVGIYLRMYEANGAPASGEIEVVPSTSDGLPTVALNEAGDVLVAWHGVAASGPDASGSAIQARVYVFGSPTPASGVLTVNTTTLGDQTDAAAVALDLSGDFVVAWAGNDADGRGIYAQRLLPSGAPRPGSPERLVNVTTVGDQEAPAIASSGLVPDPDDVNLYVVAWEGADGDDRGIFMRRFAQSGDGPRGGEERVPEAIDGDQFSPTLAVDDGFDGTVHVTAAWICQGSTACSSPLPVAIPAIAAPEGAPILVRGRRVGGPGRVAGPNEFTINQSLSSHSEPAIASEADGDFAVAWESSGQDGSGETILGRRFTVQLVFRDDFESGGLSAWEP